MAVLHGVQVVTLPTMAEVMLVVTLRVVLLGAQVVETTLPQLRLIPGVLATTVVVVVELGKLRSVRDGVHGWPPANQVVHPSAISPSPHGELTESWYHAPD